MMVGNRGETRETIEETMRFLERAKPHQYIFSCLSVYPGTRDFDDAVEAGWLDGEFYFERDFQELKTTVRRVRRGHRASCATWFLRNNGLRDGYREGVERLRGDPRAGSATTTPRTWISAARTIARGGSTRPSATCGARWSSSTRLPGLALNYLACIAGRAATTRDARDLHRGDEARPAALGARANVHAVREWAARGPAKGCPISLTRARVPAPRAHRAADAPGSAGRRLRGVASAAAAASPAGGQREPRRGPAEASRRHGVTARASQARSSELSPEGGVSRVVVCGW